MADIADAFKQHLSSLNEQEWSALVAEVRGKESSTVPGAGGKAAAQRRFGGKGAGK
ncbi:hypothetical protein PP633_01700 [Mycobacteroides abscessus]|uniref:hypothetical protein n=1 Tax=Mycobacteroides abscessus TaxID=36809 RepID=UPI0012FFE5CF|nr:hypothetical protein [Mycobacteroides abscessus]MDM2643329.1 hypothetical protein [Mycobacteroides abscessus]MDM2653132.1 hypothetical protein [Mycobacteroides abscessus]MDM2661961.1 hypothetical protein [Mycobacteroides abscessus]MDM2667069.1 hypothetical protein [Mycobacteroides abscessus]MDM2671468.1 hypothetical protein [Mycobacteroides abscessus]